jgi:hypothetical protein
VVESVFIARAKIIWQKIVLHGPICPSTAPTQHTKTGEKQREKRFG